MTQEFQANILIAEDNEISREMMASILRTQGYQIFGAEDGGRAIEIIQEQHVDLALIDINMAPKGGFDFIKFLLVYGIKVPVVVVTGDDSSDVLMEANALGVKRVLNKPVEPRLLLQVVERVLRSSGVNVKNQPFTVSARETRFSHEDLMKKAIALADANASAGKGGPFGAVVADHTGQILGEGANGISSRVDPTAHAEVMAIRKAAEKLGRADLSDCTLYCSSEPTMMGQALIISVGIRAVYFALSHDEVREMMTRESAVREEMAKGAPARTEYFRLAHEEGLAMFRKWKK